MTDWIQQNGEHLLAIIGAAYVLALLIVKITPTPKDDAALAKVAVVAQGIALVFGLKPKAPAPQAPQ